jgi:hypothetical protein
MAVRQIEFEVVDHDLILNVDVLGQIFETNSGNDG